MRGERQVAAVLATIATATALLALPDVRWTPVTLACLGLLGGAALSLLLGRRAWTYAQASVVLALSSIVLLGYLYGADPMHDVGPISTMTFFTGLTILLAALATIALIPNGVLHWILTGRDAGAMLQRRMLPVALIVMPGLGFFRLYLQQSGRDNDSLALAANITVASALLLAITTRASLALRRVDAERAEALEALRSLNLELAQRVRDRSEELERERTRVAVLQDRDRIARDLHDRVIQRLFASGLQLSSLQTRVDERVADRIEDTVTELDSVIRELRETIFNLETAGGIDAGAALTATVKRVERLLGFAPTLTMSGELSRVSPELSDHLIAVAHEALTNTVRHAAATSVSVEVTVDDHDATLRVLDNGKGLPDDLPHCSGLGNISKRADELGGSAAWVRGVPRGTVITFQVPLAPPPRDRSVV